MAARYALQSFTATVAGPPVHDDYVTMGALRDSASQTVVAAPAMFGTVPLAYGQAPHALVDYLVTRTAGP